MGSSSIPKMPNTIARFLVSILFLSRRDATRLRCNRTAFRVNLWMGGRRRIFARTSWKSEAKCFSEGALVRSGPTVGYTSDLTKLDGMLNPIFQRELEQWFGKLSQIHLTFVNNTSTGYTNCQRTLSNEAMTYISSVGLKRNASSFLSILCLSCKG